MRMPFYLEYVYSGATILDKRDDHSGAWKYILSFYNGHAYVEAVTNTGICPGNLAKRLNFIFEWSDENFVPVFLNSCTSEQCLARNCIATCAAGLYDAN